MKEVIAIIALIFAVFYSQQFAYAYDGTIVGKVTGIRYYDSTYSNRVLIQHDNMANPGNCSDTAYLFLSSTNTAFDQFNAALMTALASGLRAQLMLTLDVVMAAQAAFRLLNKFG